MVLARLWWCRVDFWEGRRYLTEWGVCLLGEEKGAGAWVLPCGLRVSRLGSWVGVRI